MSPTLRLLTALLLASVACSGPTDPATAGNSQKAQTTITELAQEPSATCTYTPNVLEPTFSDGLGVWSKVSVWELRFFAGAGEVGRRPLAHPIRNGSAVLTLLQMPTRMELLGRSGQTLLTVDCNPGS